MIQIDFWGNGNNWSIEVVDYICDDDDEDNPGCWGNSGIIGALAPPRIWDYLRNLLSLHQSLQGFGIIGATKDLGLLAQLAFSSENYFWIWDLGVFGQPRIWDYLPICPFSSESENYFYIWDLPRIWDYLSKLRQSQKTISGFGIWDYFPNQGFWIICPTCFLFSTRVRKLFMFSFLLLINPVCFWRWPE